MELRDIEIFLTLAEQLHFGRTAELLRVTPARVSQAIKKQERRIGAPLFDRSRRQVALTAIGRQLYDELLPAYRGLRQSVENARLAAQATTAKPLRLGIIGGPLDDLAPFFDKFVADHPESSIRLRSVRFGDPFGGLRSGAFDMAVLWLPVRETDLTVGPILFTEPIVLAVGARHRLAGRESVSLEDLADETTMGGAVPDYWRAALVPFTTPGGRPVPIGPIVTDWMEMVPILARGEAVSPVHAHSVRYGSRPDIAFVPIHDAPHAQWALVWRTAAETDLIRAFAQTVATLGPLSL